MKFVIAAAIIIIVFVLVNITNKPDELNSSESLATYGQIDNNVGQSMVKIGGSGLASWIEANPNCKIITITSVDKGAYGITNAFVIVYEQQ